MVARPRRPLPTSDTAALKRIGQSVRARLEADPSAYRIPIDGLEIFAVSDFFSEAECRRLMAIVDEVARPSPTYDDSADLGRTSYSGDVDPWDPFIQMLQRRIDDLLGFAPGMGETIQGQRYAVGQEFKPHFDHFSPSHSFWTTEQARGGQRSWTAMVFLNAVEQGGATEFPKTGLSIPPQAGALLAWNNMTPDGVPNPNSLHAGCPVISGTKYILTKWYRTRVWA
jgi:prolyl 4-hydroxylase